MVVHNYTVDIFHDQFPVPEVFTFCASIYGYYNLTEIAKIHDASLRDVWE